MSQRRWSRFAILLIAGFVAGTLMLMPPVAHAVANFLSALKFNGTAATWTAATGSGTGKGIYWSSVDDKPHVFSSASSFDYAISAGGGGGGGTLQTDYTSGGAGGGVITLTASGGALAVRDNAAPLGTPLLSVTDSGGTNPYFNVVATSAGGAFLELYDGTSAPVSAAHRCNVISDDVTHTAKVSCNTGAYASIVTGSGSIAGVKGAYNSGITTADNVVAETSTLGPVVLRDNVSPIGDVFDITDSANTINYLQVSPTAIKMLTKANGGGTQAFVRADNAIGARMSYGSFVDLNGNNIQLTPNVAGGTFGAALITPGGLTTTGAQLQGQWGSGSVYFSCGSGVSNIGGETCEDIVADTNGSTINQLVYWSSADKVQVTGGANQRGMAGVALNTATAGQVVHVMKRGRVKVACTGSVAANDLLVSSVTTGTAQTNNSATVGTVVGYATESCGGGFTVADLH